MFVLRKVHEIVDSLPKYGLYTSSSENKIIEITLLSDWGKSKCDSKVIIYLLGILVANDTYIGMVS